MRVVTGHDGVTDSNAQVDGGSHVTVELTARKENPKTRTRMSFSTPADCGPRGLNSMTSTSWPCSTTNRHAISGRTGSTIVDLNDAIHGIIRTPSRIGRLVPRSIANAAKPAIGDTSARCSGTRFWDRHPTSSSVAAGAARDQSGSGIRPIAGPVCANPSGQTVGAEPLSSPRAASFSRRKDSLVTSDESRSREKEQAA